MAFAVVVALRRSLTNGLMAVAVLVASVITVGLTASTNSLFSISIRPALVRLAVDFDVKVGTLHLHAGWSPLPDSTKPAAGQF